MSEIRAVVVGTGFIGPVHVEALRRIGVKVEGIIGSSPEKTKNCCRQLGLPTHLTSLQQALNDNCIEVVHLATPNHLHYEQVKQVLTAGKHVLCEKPLSLNSSESAELVELARAKSLAAGVAYNMRFYPHCHEARERFATGQLGDFFHVQGSYVQDWLLYPTDFNWRVQSESGGELRAVADIGTHWLDLIQFITGSRVTSVFAALRTIHKTRSVPQGSNTTFVDSNKLESNGIETDVSTEDCGSIMLNFENGANGILWVSQTTAGRKNCLRFEIGGSESSLSWNSEAPNQMWIGNRQQPNLNLVRDPALMSDSASQISNYPGGHNEGFPDTFKQLFRTFYRYIEASDYEAPCPFPTFEDGHYEMLLCDAILKSHRQKTWVDVG